jgi:hypothetical protein
VGGFVVLGQNLAYGLGVTAAVAAELDDCPAAFTWLMMNV